MAVKNLADCMVSKIGLVKKTLADWVFIQGKIEKFADKILLN